ncbi:sulfatase family protein [Planctomicrobium sp. SH661]|uniref:sulfatase family protein n=1 Tax=Planctomicrobium sp. SH661 TaxID=3448124 RepID=UPI003F5BAD07
MPRVFRHLAIAAVLMANPFYSVCLLFAADRPNIIVILADDMGYADVGVQGVDPDVKTPNIDRLAHQGVRCTAGYASAPQCAPSRAGLLTGRYQQRYGFDNNQDMPLTTDAVTIAERLGKAGYTCGMVGKWHLDPARNSVKWARKQGLPIQGRNEFTIPEELARPYLPAAQGFHQFFNGPFQNYQANFDLRGNPLAPQGESVVDDRFRVDIKSEAAEAFIERNHDQPFFLYVAYVAPHVPLEAPQKYLDRFSSVESLRRRYALAMISAVDDGVGRIQDALKKHAIDENTLVIFLSDNGAPLGGKKDLPVEDLQVLWDGSVNTPYRGEKGMLSEGGLRVPFIWSWPKGLPQGKVEERPVSSLDIAATAVALAGLPEDPELDGVNLVPYFTGENPRNPHENLYWRFFTQSAIRSGKWKYIKAGKEAEYLFDLDIDGEEVSNRIQDHPEIAAQLKGELEIWADTLKPRGLPDTTLRKPEQSWYEEHFGLEIKASQP